MTIDTLHKTPDQNTIDWLLTFDAIRHRCQMIYKAGVEGNLKHFKINLKELDVVTDYVFQVIKKNYPTLKIPYHSRWRHFMLNGEDQWHKITNTLIGDCEERARVAFDLIITSVLLDAGAGNIWRYKDPETGLVLGRSEGLAIASINAFKTGVFSDDPKQPLRADANRLASLTVEDLNLVFQITKKNELAGLEGRAKLINKLGTVVNKKNIFFKGEKPRIGSLFDYLKTQCINNRLEIEKIFYAITHGLGEIWPGRISIAGINLGDTWYHPAVSVAGPSNQLVPFHKLSQWITLSLIEPLEDAGISIVGSENLTALAEYRNGGLMIDLGLISEKYDGMLKKSYFPSDEIIVEWRALTVILIDMLAVRLRSALNLDEKTLPLGKVLEGGTWSAGRKIAQAKRCSGGPPLNILSDGSVF